MTQERAGNILTDEDLENLNEGIAAAEGMTELIERAKRAGIDLGDRPVVLEELKTKARAIKQAFFPGR